MNGPIQIQPRQREQLAPSIQGYKLQLAELKPVVFYEVAGAICQNQLGKLRYSGILEEIA